MSGARFRLRPLTIGVVLALAALGAGCEAAAEPTDAGAPDAGESLDAPPGTDGGGSDAPRTDGGGEMDAPAEDAGDIDAGDIDAGDIDAGEADGGGLDASSADAGTDGGGFCGPTVSFSGEIVPIFVATCNGVGCHSGPLPASGLSLTAGNAYAALVGVPSTQCTPTRLLVAPGDPDNSYLVHKLEAISLCLGTIMPKIGPPLSAAQITLIRDWICEGAPNN